MRLKRALLLSAFLLPLGASSAHAADFESFSCQPSTPGNFRCHIQLRGKVQEGEMLFLPRVQDADRLFHDKQLLGSTGFLLGRPFYAAQFPRVYALQPISGQDSPTLTLEVSRFVHDGQPLLAAARVIGTEFPLRKAYGKFLLQLLAFAALAWTIIYGLRSLRDAPRDGWTYPTELRWLAGALATYLLLGSEWPRALVPWAWSFSAHNFAREISLSVALWAFGRVLLESRFSDRSCVERGLHRRAWHGFSVLADSALLGSLALHLWPARPAFLDPQLLPALALLPVIPAAARSLEWRRVAKRSSLAPLVFHGSLYAAGFLLALGSIASFWPKGEAGPATSMFWGSAILLATGAWRGCAWRATVAQSRSLTQECRALLALEPDALRRLDSLCFFLEQEWGAARVSLISVNGEQGLVLSSAGRDAIPHESRLEARKMGPFLKRVCRSGRILYAPVVEELGRELQAQGLKHSSLALPLLQGRQVRLVLCLMAEEGERISARDASVLDQLCAGLSLEILSAAAQHVAEEKSSRLLTIARRADGLLVEHLDHWGLLRLPTAAGNRAVLGLSLPRAPGAAWRQAPLLRAAHQEFRREAAAAVRALATAFEFVVKDNQDEAWFVSPREFRHAWLRELGQERAAALLAWIAERQFRAIALKENHLLLGLLPGRLMLGSVALKTTRSHGPGSLDLDAEELASLQARLRNPQLPESGIFLAGTVPSALPSFCARGDACTGEEGIHSILSLVADKKELRRLEQKIQEELKEALRRAA